ncbi:uncharacterized protein LOC117117412 [Anneissia japonica]|uniref:uncharacterized protein LOC117117412 n=1 Tax=Anneissia japonica TaxID=1529436 RepID=UPI001425B2A7|nr:uncharacterized protein LOC117117412 [Anneissia japonica]
MHAHEQAKIFWKRTKLMVFACFCEISNNHISKKSKIPTKSHRSGYHTQRISLNQICQVCENPNRKYPASGGAAVGQEGHLLIESTLIQLHSDEFNQICVNVCLLGLSMQNLNPGLGIINHKAFYSCHF